MKCVMYGMSEGAAAVGTGKRAVIALFFGALLLLQSHVCFGAPNHEVNVRAEKIRLHKPFAVDVILSWSGSADRYVINPLHLPELEGLSVEGSTVRARTTADGVELVTQLTLVAYEEGPIVIPAFEIRYREAGGEEDLSVLTNETEIDVEGTHLLESVLVTAIAVGAAAIVVIAVTVAVVSRRRKKVLAPLPDVTALPTLSAALESLRPLRLSGDYGEYLQRLKQYCLETDPGVVQKPGFTLFAAAAEGAKFGGRSVTSEDLEELERMVKRWLT